MMVCFLGLREWGSAQLWRRLGLYTGVTVGLLLPFVVFVQTTAGLVRYVGGSEPQVRTIASFRSSFLSDPMAFKMDSSAPLWVVEPAPDRRVNVRWAEGVDDAVRQEREGRYGLTAGVRQEVEGWTWSYVLTDHESATVRSLVEDRLVEDTAGIERGSFRLVPEPWDQWLERRLVVLRLRLLPGVLTPRNALAWFYYVTMLVPIVALGRVGADWWSERAARPEAAVVTAVAILCCIISHTLIRGFPDSQLPDVAAPTFVLAAWLAGRRSGPAGSPVRARLARAGIVSLILVTFWSVWSFGAGGKLVSVGSLLVGSGVVGGPVGVWEQLGAVNRRLHLRPIGRLGLAGERSSHGYTLRSRLHGAVRSGARDLVRTGPVLLRRTGVRRWSGLPRSRMARVGRRPTLDDRAHATAVGPDRPGEAGPCGKIQTGISAGLRLRSGQIPVGGGIGIWRGAVLSESSWTVDGILTPSTRTSGCPVSADVAHARTQFPDA